MSLRAGAGYICVTGIGPFSSRSSHLPRRGGGGGTSGSATRKHDLLLAAQGRTSLLLGKQLPVPLGNDFDDAIGHLHRGLIVDRVRWHGEPRGPLFCVG